MVGWGSRGWWGSRVGVKGVVGFRGGGDLGVKGWRVRGGG